MAKSYYELHITMEAADSTEREKVEVAVKALGWKFSAIDGDIVLGDGVKLYATKHFNSRYSGDDMTNILFATAKSLEAQGIKVTRRKVELVIYDDRSSKVRPESCTGGCIGCHLDDLKGGTADVPVEG